ncbi:MlaD family protein [Nocardia sp. NPDC056064]|uniref:MlaD family protein n=1 Tax=Nocardia sp. NPDC056064 TaxID=3345701 RepID=UPI0035DDE1B6
MQQVRAQESTDQKSISARWRAHRPHARRRIALAVAVATVGGLGLLGADSLVPLPFGSPTYTAELSEALSVKPGYSVQVAGVPVGRVVGLELKPDRVLMRFTVDEEVFVGDQSSIELRMLTMLAGNYVALFPQGDRPLGRTPIPMERVVLPYSLLQTFQDAVTPVQQINGDLVHRSMLDLSDAIAQAPEALRTVLATTNSYLDALDRQRGQASQAVAVAQEYISAFDGASMDLGRLVHQVSLLQTVLQNRRAELREGVRLVAVILDRAAGLAPTWDSTVEPRLQQLTGVGAQLENAGGHIDSLLQSLARLVDTLRSASIPAGSAGEASAPVVSVCIPVPGQGC